MTGRALYEEAAAVCVDLVNHTELAERKDIALRIAIWYWQSRKVGPLARLGDTRAVTRKINGKLNGLADRQIRFDRYRQILALQAPAAPSPSPVSLQRQP